ncbi:MAG: hypothetical protein HY042_01050, partial [Spirochaetia bacterium]|nr:hypothetical protein [Spirochaetia bacterium]
MLYAIGNWKGDFLPDGAGRGGLAALHSLIRSERTLIEKDGGKVLLVNTGDLTGSKTS